MPPFRKQETLEKFRRDILHKFQRPGFPAISGCIFVSGTSGENIEDLRHIIHQSALRMNQESEMGKIVSTNLMTPMQLYLLFVTINNPCILLISNVIFLGTNQLFGTT